MNKTFEIYVDADTVEEAVEKTKETLERVFQEEPFRLIKAEGYKNLVSDYDISWTLTYMVIENQFTNLPLAPSLPLIKEEKLHPAEKVKEITEEKPEPGSIKFLQQQFDTRTGVFKDVPYE